MPTFAASIPTVSRIRQHMSYLGHAAAMHERAPLHGGIVRPRTALAAAGCHGTCDRAIAPPSDHPFKGAIQASHPLRDDHPYKSTRTHTDPVRLSSIAAVDSDRWRASIAVTPSTLTSALPWVVDFGLAGAVSAFLAPMAAVVSSTASRSPPRPALALGSVSSPVRWLQRGPISRLRSTKRAHAHPTWSLSSAIRW